MYSITQRTAPDVQDLDPTIFVLADGRGSTAEVWPALGMNVFRWLAVRAGQTLDVLYSDPALFQGARPTRSGIPVLFPFPNRIRDGRFAFAGKAWQLPLNDPVQKNSIHGFACRAPWRIVDQGTDAESAWLTGVFRCSADAPDSLPLWPADHEMRLTIRLGHGVLRLEAVVHNPDSVPLPFGLGYHPYFRLPCTGASPADECAVAVPATAYWPLDGNLPTGAPLPMDPRRDLNQRRRVGELTLDDVLTALPARAARMDGLIERGTLWAGATNPLRLFCSPVFREMVVFNPPHRQAFCIEPYTCATDAANRDDGGWLTLAPGANWSATVELWV